MPLYRMKCRKLDLAAFICGMPSLWHEEYDDVTFTATSDGHALTKGNRIAFLKLRDVAAVEVPELIDVGSGKNLLAATMEPTTNGFVVVEHTVPQSHVCK
jgi:hypothetical protein